MNLDALIDRDADFLIREVDAKFKPIFEKKEFSEDEKRAIYRYLFSRKPQKLPPSLKNRLINLYDPLADRSTRFPDGLRFCINVYVGCEHNCPYCYVNGYSQESVGISPHQKKDFEKNLSKDLQSLRSLGVPASPLHMSNSTDPLQKTLEKKHSNTLIALQKLREHRSQFTSITILTKNPAILCTEPYLSIIKDGGMKLFTVQITCAYWDDNVRAFYEPKAPDIHERLHALKFLAENGVDVELRIDPLFPSSRIPETIRLHKPLYHYSLPEAQSHEDISNLVRFAKKSGAKAVISKPLKVPFSKRAQRCKDLFSIIYKDASGKGKRKTVGGTWRLPDNYQKALMSTVSDICAREGIPFKHCMVDVLGRD